MLGPAQLDFGHEQLSTGWSAHPALPSEFHLQPVDPLPGQQISPHMMPFGHGSLVGVEAIVLVAAGELVSFAVGVAVGGVGGSTGVVGVAAAVVGVATGTVGGAITVGDSWGMEQPRILLYQLTLQGSQQ